jgi:hypothetical protein
MGIFEITLENYLPALDLNCDPPEISASRVARIAGMSHWHLALLNFFFFFLVLFSCF